MPTVAISYSEEKHRSFERVLAQVREALEHLGGMDAFVKPGQTVLIKPDQAVACSAEKGCTTDPFVVGALIHLARIAGAAKIQVGESSEGFYDSLGCMRGTGMAAIAAREGAELIDLGNDSVANREVDLPEGRVLHRVPIPAPLLDADVIIAAPKAKTQYFDHIAGAMHLWVGIVNQHWREAHRGAEDMMERFADIMAVVRPDLCVTDALICGEGDGPIGNLPHWCGCILASTDPVATDMAIARLLGLDPRKLRFAAIGEERGVGAREPIVWLGNSIERLAIDAWRGHEGFRHLPVNVLAGKGVSWSGTLGHVKAALDTLLHRGLLEQVLCKHRTPSIMIGDCEDPHFERHVGEGPYVVIDDAARPEYKNDRRVFFVPGHPVLHTVMPQLIRGLGIRPAPEEADWDPNPLPDVPPVRRNKSRTPAVPVAFAALAIGAMLGIRALGRR